jgi:hypothetical protein
MASLGAGAASAQAIFDSGHDLVCGSRPVHCCMDLRGPSNGWLIRYGLSPNIGSPAGASGFCKLMVLPGNTSRRRPARRVKRTDPNLRTERRRSSVIPALIAGDIGNESWRRLRRCLRRILRTDQCRTAEISFSKDLPFPWDRQSPGS